MKFNVQKNWAYLVFIIPYALISLFGLISPQIISTLGMNAEAVKDFQIYRIVTMFLIDPNLLSILFTAYISYIFFQFLGEMIPQVKLALMVLISMVLAGILLHFLPYSISTGSVGAGFLFFILIFFLALGSAAFLYREEVMARAFISRLWFLIFIEAYIIIRNGSLSVFLHAVVGLSVLVVLFCVYYFTKPRQGYAL